MSEKPTALSPKVTMAWMLSAGLGVVFIGAAVTKFTYSIPLEKEITSALGLGADWGPTAAVLARLLIALELALGLSLLQPHWRKRVVLPAAIAVLTGFTVYLVTLGNDPDNCGCFGSFIEMDRNQSIVKNLVMIPACIAAILLSPTYPKRKVIVPFLLAVASTAIVFAIIPVTNQAKDFSAMTGFEGGRRTVNDGIVLLCFFSATCEHCKETADMVAGYSDSDVHAFFVFLGEDEAITRFREEMGVTEIPYKAIGADEFFTHIGNAPPRVYLLKDGRVVTHWDGEVDLKTIQAAVADAK